MNATEMKSVEGGVIFLIVVAMVGVEATLLTGALLLLTTPAY